MITNTEDKHRQRMPPILTRMYRNSSSKSQQNIKDPIQTETLANPKSNNYSKMERNILQHLNITKLNHKIKPNSWISTKSREREREIRGAPRLTSSTMCRGRADILEKEDTGIAELSVNGERGATTKFLWFILSKLHINFTRLLSYLPNFRLLVSKASLCLALDKSDAFQIATLLPALYIRALNILLCLRDPKYLHVKVQKHYLLLKYSKEKNPYAI